MWFKRKVLGHFAGKVIAESCSEVNAVQLYAIYKPLTPPIELIDGKAYQFEHSSVGVALGFYLKDKELFDCAGTYYSIESGCTNIQLLGVTK